MLDNMADPLGGIRRQDQLQEKGQGMTSVQTGQRQ